jgi:hypothetical protein
MDQGPPRQAVRTPDVILESAAHCLRLLVLRLRTMTREEIYAVLTTLQRDLYELMDFYNGVGPVQDM